MNPQFLISIREQYQGNKLFTESDLVIFDPLFKRLREAERKPFVQKDKLHSLEKSIIKCH